MQTMNPGVLKMAVPAMYGVEGPSLAAGWLFHQCHGVFLGLLYVVLVDNLGALRRRAKTLEGAVGLGIGYGVVTTLLPVLVMPLWLSGVGFEMGPPFPNLGFPQTAIGTVNHIIYAVPVALAYYLVARRD